MHESNSNMLKSIIKLLYVVTLYSTYSIIKMTHILPLFGF